MRINLLSIVITKMPMSNKTRKNRKTTKGFRKSRGATRKSKASTLVQKVKSVILRNEESKYVAETILPISKSGTHNGSILQQADWYRIVPTLSQGGTSYQREGKVISPTRIKLHVHAAFPSLDSNAEDITVVIYLLSWKGQQAWSAGNGTTGSEADVGGHVVQGYSGYLATGSSALNYGFNGDWESFNNQFVRNVCTPIAKRSFRLHKPCGILTGPNIPATGTNSSATAGVASAAMRLSGSATFNIKCPTDLKYVDETHTQPSNFMPTFAVGYYYNNNGDADLSTTYKISVAAWSEMFYKDS